MATLLLVGCGDPSPRNVPATGGPEAEHAFDPDSARAGTTLAEMTGHLVAARELYEHHDRAGALEHAEHSIETLVTMDADELDVEGAGVSTVSAEVDDAIAAIDGGEPPEAVGEAVAAVVEAMQEVIAGFVEGSVEPEAFRGSIVIGLVEGAAHAYARAVDGEDGTIGLPTDYEDGYGFTDVARRLYGDIEVEVITGSPEKARGIEESFGILERAMPSIEAPRYPADVADVEAAAEEITRFLQETIDALVPAPAPTPEAGS